MKKQKKLFFLKKYLTNTLKGTIIDLVISSIDYLLIFSSVVCRTLNGFMTASLIGKTDGDMLPYEVQILGGQILRNKEINNKCNPNELFIVFILPSLAKAR